MNPFFVDINYRVFSESAEECLGRHDGRGSIAEKRPVDREGVAAILYSVSW